MDWEESYLTIQVVFIIIPALIGTYLPSLSRFTITTHFIIQAIGCHLETCALHFLC
jgi:hypothetical protein